MAVSGAVHGCPGQARPGRTGRALCPAMPACLPGGRDRAGPDRGEITKCGRIFYQPEKTASYKPRHGVFISPEG